MASSTLSFSNHEPRISLVICNISKLTNVKSLIMSAAAFGCAQVLVVGQGRNTQNETWIPKSFREHAMVPKNEKDKNNEEEKEEGQNNTADSHKSHQRAGHVQLHRFAKWNECLEYLQENKMYLMGVEIDEKSAVLDDDYNPPSNQTHLAILMGNEGQGIHPKHLQACHSLIRIPQYGTGTASFNVNVAASIVFHHLYQWKRQKLEADCKLDSFK